jgi:hypothetical protein
MIHESDFHLARVSFLVSVRIVASNIRNALGPPRNRLAPPAVSAGGVSLWVTAMLPRSRNSISRGLIASCRNLRPLRLKAISDWVVLAIVIAALWYVIAELCYFFLVQ